MTRPSRRMRALLALALMLASACAFAQPAQKVPRIGMLFAPPEAVHAPLRDAFLQGLRDLGYEEGRTIVLEKRYAEGHPERLPKLASELVELKVDVIVTAAFPAINAARARHRGDDARSAQQRRL